MTDEHPYSIDSARAAAARGELAPWVAEFLASPGSDNDVLGEVLTDRLRWWTGPVEVPIDRLHRLAGPPGEPVLVTVEDDEWRDDVEDLEEKVSEGWEPPPVIATWKDGQLVLEDGNHRVEGLRRAGTEKAWTIIGFATEEERDGFTVAAAT
jgi:hypothetical protein